MNRHSVSPACLWHNPFNYSTQTTYPNSGSIRTGQWSQQPSFPQKVADSQREFGTATLQACVPSVLLGRRLARVCTCLMLAPQTLASIVMLTFGASGDEIDNFWPDALIACRLLGHHLLWPLLLFVPWALTLLTSAVYHSC